MWSVFNCGAKARALDEVSTEDSESCQDVVEKYDIGSLIGSGGFAEVRVCTLRKDNSDPVASNGSAYAVKIIDLHSAAVQRCDSFLSAADEAEILSSLRHPNIIQVMDIIQEGHFLYVVMEFVRGGELFMALAEPSIDVPERDIARLARELLEAIRYLHKWSIVHRDIKAENLLLTEPPGTDGLRGSLKLIDFGLAIRLEVSSCCSLFEEDAKQLTLACGTPQYCAPEMWTAGNPDAPPEWLDIYGMFYGPKADVWAAGVVIYLALFGGYPFNGGDALKIMAASCNPRKGPSYRPARPTPGYQASRHGVAFLERLLTKDQEARPAARQALRDPWLARLGAPVHLPPLHSDTFIPSLDDDSIFSAGSLVPADIRAVSLKESRRAEPARVGAAVLARRADLL